MCKLVAFDQEPAHPAAGGFYRWGLIHASILKQNAIVKLPGTKLPGATAAMTALWRLFGAANGRWVRDYVTI
jgi:hypothetical protein